MIIKVRNDRGLDGVKVVKTVRFWMYFEVKSTGFPVRLEVGGERKRGVRNDTRIFGPNIEEQSYHLLR